MSRIWMLVATFSVCICCMAQSPITIKGRVTDADTKEGIPFANVFFGDSFLGTSTDVDGYYELITGQASDTLVASAIGYQVVKKSVSRDSLQTINFLLSTEGVDLSEVVVIAGENPANAIVRNIIRNKTHNRMEGRQSYQYESYAKVELDLENIPPKLRKNKLLKPFNFIFENVDSTSDEKPFIPAYINESITDVYYTKKQGPPRKVIRAQRTSGVDNETIIEFIKNIHDEFSIYDNWIKVVEKPFISPFANGALGFYEYYIIDSTYLNQNWSYKLKFKPKRRQENTFYGDFWVADSSFAIQRVNMRMSPEVNINLVKRIIIYQEFLPDSIFWVPAKQKMIVDFSPAKEAPGLIGRRTETFRNVQINHNKAPAIAEKRGQKLYQQNDVERGPEFWEQARHEPLTETEASIYKMVDSLTNMPLYRTYVEVLETIFTGYFEVGSVEFGPYFSLYSRNVIEGDRFRMGVRTNKKFSNDLLLGGYLAYGLRDQRFKYGFNIDWLINRRPRVIVGAGHKNDISINSESSEEFQEVDLFSGAFRRDILQKLIRVEETKIYAERFWTGGLSNRFTLLHRKMDPYGNLFAGGGGFNYAFLNNTGVPSDVDTTISTTELSFKTRFAPGEEFLDSRMDRVSIGTEKPIIEFRYTLGINGFLSGDYTYHKLSLYYRHYLNINPIGWFSYRFKAGKVFGRIPFLLLEVHPGNESYFMTRGIFNTMNRYEFASDTYFSALLEHHFDGFLFNKIPLIRKLNLRAVASFKTVAGQLSTENAEANQRNLFQPTDENTYSGFRAPSRAPYMEAGFGIENILKVIRVDALWRLNYLDNPEATRFTVVGGFYFFF